MTGKSPDLITDVLHSEVLGFSQIGLLIQAFLSARGFEV